VSSAELDISDVPERNRYEAHSDGELAGFLRYRLRGDRLALLHTEVLPAFEGHGVGGALVARALDDAAARRQGVLPYCPFAQGWMARHPDRIGAIPEEERSRFGF
jgi:predicted GNAT family acetyltransferase